MFQLLMVVILSQYPPVTCVEFVDPIEVHHILNVRTGDNQRCYTSVRWYNHTFTIPIIDGYLPSMIVKQCADPQHCSLNFFNERVFHLHVFLDYDLKVRKAFRESFIKDGVIHYKFRNLVNSQPKPKPKIVPMIPIRPVIPKVVPQKVVLPSLVAPLAPPKYVDRLDKLLQRPTEVR